MTNPRMSLIRMVTGQMMSNLSPREPAMTSSFAALVAGKGHEMVAMVLLGL